jgi:hypothetical protein
MHKESFIINRNTLLHVSTLLGHLQGERFVIFTPRLHFIVEWERAVDRVLCTGGVNLLTTPPGRDRSKFTPPKTTQTSSQWIHIRFLSALTSVIEAAAFDEVPRKNSARISCFPQMNDNYSYVSLPSGSTLHNYITDGYENHKISYHARSTTQNFIRPNGRYFPQHVIAVMYCLLLQD